MPTVTDRPEAGVGAVLVEKIGGRKGRGSRAGQNQRNQGNETDDLIQGFHDVRGAIVCAQGRVVGIQCAG